MRSVTKSWFIATAKYDFINDSGVQVKVTGNYAVDAVNLTELEGKTLDFLANYFNGEINIVKAGLAPFHEILFSDKDDEDKYYEIKVKLITLDERTGKEKKSAVPYLVQGKSTSNAEQNVRTALNGSDYEITKVAESSILDVVES